MAEDSTKLIDMVTYFRKSLKGDVYDDMAQNYTQIMLNIAKAEDILKDKLVANNVKVTSDYHFDNVYLNSTALVFPEKHKYINVVEFKCINCGANELKDNICVYCGTKYKKEDM